MRLTKKLKPPYEKVAGKDYIYTSETRLTQSFASVEQKLGQLEDIEDELGIDLIDFLQGIDPNTCFMEITKDKKFYLCGDAYYGDYSKEELLKLIQELLFMYWALAKKELLKDGN